MSRPTTLTDEMKRRASEATVKELLADGHIEAEEAQHCINDLCKVGRHYMDGYELAKALDDRCFWDCTRQMVDVLDNFEWHARREMEAAEKKWFEATNPQPPFPLGTRVELPRGGTGVLDRIYEHGVAAYAVKVDDDPMGDEPHRRRLIIRFEDAKALEP